MPRRSSSLFPLLILILPAPGSARAPARDGVVERPVVIVGTASAQSLSPAVASTASGTRMVVWTETQSGTAVLRGRIYDRSDVALGPAFQVSAGGLPGTPRVAAGPTGLFAVVWDDAAGQDGTSGAVLARVYTQGGFTPGPPFLVNTLTNLNESRPSVAWSGPSQFAVIWARRAINAGGASQGIWLRRFGASGTPIDAQEIRLDDPLQNRGGQNAPDLAFWPAGHFVAVWQDGIEGTVGAASPDGSGIAILGRWFSAVVLPLAPAAVLTNTTAFDQFEPAVRTSARNHALVGWCGDVGSTTNVDAFVRRFDDTGQAAGAETDLTPLPGEQLFMGLALDENGDAADIWVDQAGATLPSGPRASLDRFARDGQNLTPALPAEALPGSASQQVPRIAMDEKGNITAVWQHGAAPNLELRLRTFRRNQIVLSGNTAASISAAQQIHITLDSPGDAFRPYVLAFTGAIVPAFLLDGRIVESDPLDPLFQLTLHGLVPQFFPANYGLLDSAGLTGAPAVAIPPVPALAGVVIHALFATGGSGPSGVESISDPRTIVFTP